MSLDTPTREPRTEPVKRQGRIAAVVTAGVVAAGLIAGGGYALGHLGSDTTTSQSQLGGGPGGGNGGGFGGGQNGMGGPPVSGTVTAVTGTSITVTPQGGTATTYSVTSDTQIMDDGVTAQLSDLAVGDAVVVLSGTASGSSGTATADRIMAGTSASLQGGPGGQQGQQGQPGGTPPSGAPQAGGDT